MTKYYLDVGNEIYEFEKKLFPYDRFLMGEGVRKTLKEIKEILSEFEIHEVESGTKVFDWVIPDEWIVREAYIEDQNHQKVIDFKDNNLHVMAYSRPVDAWLLKDELKEYVHTNTDYPDTIPYVTSYYKDNIGMCMPQSLWNQLDGGAKYHIRIDSEKIKGVLSYGELVVKGSTEEEVIFHSAICHPSLANDELSGPALAVFLAREISKMEKRRYTYRFIFVPETIGAIAYISHNFSHLKTHVKAGFILSCEGDDGDYSYLPTISGDTLADRAGRKVLETIQSQFKTYTFMDRGSDERQYNSPGVDIPVCLICRTLAGKFKEYHTSADNMDFVSPKGFAGSFEVFWNIILLLEHNFRFKTKTLCEPQLGKRGLYSNIGTVGSKSSFKDNVDFLAYADGKRDLIEISDITGIDFRDLIYVASIMKENGLVEMEG